MLLLSSRMLNTAKLEFSLAYWIDAKSVIFSSPFSGQSALLSAQIIYPNLHVTHPHRRSTTNPLFPFTSILNVTLFRTIIPNHEVHLCVSCNGYFSSFVTKGDRKPFTVIPSIGGCHFLIYFQTNGTCMYSLMFHENLPKLNLGHFWPGSLFYDQGCTRVPGYL